jgi:uncharacterized membrane protein
MENIEEVKNVENPGQPEKKENTMPAIVSYLWWIGWLISYFGLYKDNKNEFTTFHIRQSLGVHITSIAVILIGVVIGILFGIIHVRIFYSIGNLLDWALRLLILAMMIMGLISASQGQKKPLPVVGELFQNWFKGIN